MNIFIKEQLKKCRVDLPPWNNDTTKIIIPLVSNNNLELTTRQIYIKNYVLNEPPNFTLSHEWNNDTVPPENKMYVKILETRGKMIKVEGKGVYSNIPWVGWLPQASFEEE